MPLQYFQPVYFSCVYFQSLEWKLSQKVAEMTAAEEKAQLVDERRQAEANGLNQSLQVRITRKFLQF